MGDAPRGKGGADVAIPYPPDGARAFSQNREHRISAASAVIEALIDESPSWDRVTEEIAQRLRLDVRKDADRTAVQDAFLAAELDLEWAGVIVYDDDVFRRPGSPTDPAAVRPDQLRDVADAVWSLGWPNPNGKPSRSIHECFLALGGRYRHCDVYWAMHKYLKGHRLRVVRRNWMLLHDVTAVLADPTLPAGERLALERELERDLVSDYVSWLGRDDVRKYLFSNGREADLYDHHRSIIVEAKANHQDDVTVAHGVGQAMYYRSLGELGDNDRVAVLLPGRPSQEVVNFLDHYDVGLIHRDGGAFRERPPVGGWSFR